MSGTTISTADLSPRRRRILFRAWHRGMREMDILLGQFADSHIAKLSEAELDQLEALMDEPDPEIFKWLTGAAPLPERFETPVFAKIKSFHTHQAPIHA